MAEAYMSDRQGRRVTPQIIPSDSEDSHKRLTAAEQSQRNAELKRRQLGVGVDKDGARLANDKRRRGFVDDDDTMEVVDDDE